MSTRSCRGVRSDLSAYLDGDLDPGRTGETRVHLENCAACRSELDLMRLTVGALRRLPDLPPPAGILAGVRARLQPKPWYRRLRWDGRQWLVGVPAGALATLLVVLGISFFQARYPDLSKTGTTIPFPPPAAPERQPEPGAKRMVAVERSLAGQPAGVGTPPNRGSDKEALALSAQEADGGAVPRLARLAGKKAATTKQTRMVCLPSPDGVAVDDLTLRLRREGAGDIDVSELEPRAVHEAFTPYRGRLGPLPEPSRGWAVTASVPPRSLARLLDALTTRTGPCILEQPVAAAASEDPTKPRDLRITVLR